MTFIKSSATILAASIVGAALGVYFSHPTQVKAASGFIYVQKVQEGNNYASPFAGSDYIGFSCTQQDCYVATRK